ncbi:alpha/beta fold hydrolase [Natrinema sp. H-ect1]|uniref:alpha/beta fold hydrolase n=1 Tax=Natrinema sp. H-ect1 TaxID=3242700 RepID=UPI00359CC70E
MTQSRSDASAEDDGRGADPPTIVTEADGRRVAYADYGDPNGTPVVALHGTPGSRRFGALFDDQARENGVRLLVPDRPGYGRSSPVPDRDVADTGATVAAVLEAEGVSRAGIVAFSGGGPHALAVAATRGDLVTEIDIVSGAPPPSLAADLPVVQRLLGSLARRTPRLLSGLLGVQARLVERTPPAVVLSQYTTAAERTEIPPAMAERVRRDFLEGVGTQRDGFVTETRLVATQWEFSPSDIDHTVRLWHGDADANAPLRGARRLRERLPDGELTVLEDAGHLTALSRSRSRIVRSQR